MERLRETEPITDTIAKVAEYTTAMDVAHEDWQKAIAVDGLLATETELEWAQSAIDRAIDTQTSNGQFAYGWGNYPKEWARWTEYDVDTYNPTTLAAALADGALEFYGRTGEERYLEAVEKQTTFLDGVERTSTGAITRRREEDEIWTETLSFVCPYLIRYGTITDSPEYIKTARDQIRIHVDHLLDSRTNLFRHIWRETPDCYPASSFWSRANGWALAGILESTLRLPDEYDTSQLHSLVKSTATTLLKYQDTSGFWHQKIDDTTTPLESSGTLIFAYALRTALNEGIIDNQRFRQAARDGFAAVRREVDSNGAVHRVSKPPASARSELGVTPYGQGWFLKAATQFVTNEQN